jgi:malonate transporter and related proteins
MTGCSWPAGIGVEVVGTEAGQVQGVLEGFAVIGAVIALGYLLGHLGVLDLAAQVMLARLSFFVASPALMVTVLETADVSEVFSKSLAATAGAVVVTGACYLFLARLVWRKEAADTLIGLLSSVYVNAGNLGLPIAAYVLGDAALVAPVLLMQLLVLQPLALGALDSATAAVPFSLSRIASRAFTNPLTVGTTIGVLLSFTRLQLPDAIHDPLELVGGMAVPAMLLAYGVSLRLGPLPGSGTTIAEIGCITALKLVVQPSVACLIGYFALGLDGTALLAVTVLAALPTAQNIFVHATRYDRAVIVARDSIFVTTILSVPVLFVIAALLA